VTLRTLGGGDGGRGGEGGRGGTGGPGGDGGAGALREGVYCAGGPDGTSTRGGDGGDGGRGGDGGPGGCGGGGAGGPSVGIFAAGESSVDYGSEPPTFALASGGAGGAACSSPPGGMAGEPGARMELVGITTP
ncbi:MAG: hypothetical protein KA761_15135, partial [Gemmatimonadaceae bacterium]|nr:hypothetical protein [Gemmatimonadaceae bacterium]